MKPRIFLSAVTSEFCQLRQLVANVLIRLGYDPIWQDIFGTEEGDLRQMLRKQIDDCEGLIQIVERAYGAEPATADENYGRVSYTQFEFLYARERGKKTWLIFAEDGCTRDRKPEALDRPPDPSHPKPDVYQAERRALQEAWRQRLKNDGHLRHGASTDTELELKVERLKNEFDELRREFREWQKHVTGDLQAISQQLAALRPEQIKEHLRQTIEATYQKELDQADNLTGWQKRDDAKRDAAAARNKRLDQVDDFLTSITSSIKAGDASPEFLELTRIIQEEGVDQALAYITSQESRPLERAEKLAAEK